MAGIMGKINSCKPKYPKWLVTRKCCFCVPLRKGIIVFGYANLVPCFLSFPIIAFMLVHMTAIEAEHPRAFDFVMAALLFLVVDLTNTVILLIGIHKMKKPLLKLYFYVGIVLQIISLSIDLIFSELRQFPENCLYYTMLALNIYLLFLVYNIIYYIEEHAEVQYVAHEEQTENNV